MRLQRLGAGKKPDTDRWAADWTPATQGCQFSGLPGQPGLSRNRLPGAASSRRTLTLQPDNAIALNNRAWIRGQLDEEGALADAERANTWRQPAPFADTWAMLLSAANQHDKAVELRQRWCSCSPGNWPTS